MNNEENHGFTSFDFITMMISFVVIAAVTGPIIRKNIQSDQKTDRARSEAQNLARSLLDPRRIETLDVGKGFPNNPKRSIASLAKTDDIPKIDLEAAKAHLKNGESQGNFSVDDEWGHKWHYAYLNNDKGNPAYVAVWSDGPDGISQTSVRAQAANPHNAGQLDLKGDDIGTVITIR